MNQNNQVLKAEYSPQVTLNFLDINIPRPTVTISAYASAVSSFLESMLVVPIIQDSSGSHYKWTVEKGDKIAEGQIIATSTRGDSSCLFSPIPGIVKDFCEVELSSGAKSEALVITLSGEFSFLGKNLNAQNMDSFTVQQLLDSIERYGILNTFEALTPHLLIEDINKNTPCNTIVVRLFGQDNSVITDTLVANYYFEKVIKGTILLSKATGAKNIIFACDKTTHDGVKSLYKYFVNELDEYTKSNPCQISMKVAAIDTKCYPSGNKSALAHSLKKEKLLDDSQPIIFIDSCVSMELFQTLSFDKGVIEKYIVVSGDAIRHTTFMKVRIGTKLRDISKMLGGFIDPCTAVITNGFITGGVTTTLDTPITKATKSIYYATSRVLHDQTEQDCIHCGACRAVCPKHLAVDKVFDAIRDRRDSVFEKSAIFCDDCGLCNLICPSRRPLCQLISRINHG